MSIVLQLLVTVEAQHTNGPFAAKEELIESLQNELGEPSTLTGHNDGEYDVVNFSAEEHVPVNDLLAAARAALTALQGGGNVTRSTKALQKALRPYGST